MSIIVINLMCNAHYLSHNELVQTGQTALSIAQKLGYISVVETLKVRKQPLTLVYDDWDR